MAKNESRRTCRLDQGLEGVEVLNEEATRAERVLFFRLRVAVRFRQRQRHLLNRPQHRPAVPPGLAVFRRDSPFEGSTRLGLLPQRIQKHGQVDLDPSVKPHSQRGILGLAGGVLILENAFRHQLRMNDVDRRRRLKPAGIPRLRPKKPRP